MVGEPSRAAPEIDFALGGRDFQGDIGNARSIGDVPFNSFARAISAARINLNVTRRSHATVPLSSTCRPFELASAGAAIVSNPHEGIEQWFTPGEEIVVVDDAERGARRLSGAARRPGPRRRRWARGPASASSTSTRTRTAPVGCSACRARAGGAFVSYGAGDRRRPRAQRGGGDRRCDRRDPGLRRRRSTWSWSTTARLTPPRGRRRARCGGSHAARSTSGSGARCRRGSCTRCEHGLPDGGAPRR